MRLRIVSDPAFVGPVRRAIEHFCQSVGFDAAAAGEVGLCVNEAMANVIRHAYSGARDRPIELTSDFTGDSVRIELRDWGNGRRPPEEPRHDPERPGGLGLVCLKSLLDEVRFAPQPDGMLLTLKRKLHREGSTCHL